MLVGISCLRKTKSRGAGEFFVRPSAQLFIHPVIPQTHTSSEGGTHLGTLLEPEGKEESRTLS